MRSDHQNSLALIESQSVENGTKKTSEGIKADNNLEEESKTNKNLTHNNTSLQNPITTIGKKIP